MSKPVKKLNLSAEGDEAQTQNRTNLGKKNIMGGKKYKTPLPMGSIAPAFLSITKHIKQY